MTQQLIFKIIKEDSTGVLTGIAEKMEWTFIPKPMLSGKDIEVGNFVWGYVLHDEGQDEFYGEQNPQKDFATEEEFNEQEEDF